MPSLKQFRDRIAGVKNTRKITQAMKMVAAAKLRKAQERAQAAQPYARAMAGILGRLASTLQAGSSAPKLLTGTGRNDHHLLVVLSSDRGLCGGFNANVLRLTRQKIDTLRSEGKSVQVMVVGRKAAESLKRELGGDLIDRRESGTPSYALAEALANDITARFEGGMFDVCTLVYNDFKSILLQKPVAAGLIPFQLPANENAASTTPAEFEPCEESVLADILPRNIAVQIYRAMLDSAAGEQAARMTAMDNATRNAGDMIKRLTLTYNRARQAHITKELIEIISGAEAV